MDESDYSFRRISVHTVHNTWRLPITAVVVDGEDDAAINGFKLAVAASTDRKSVV